MPRNNKMLDMLNEMADEREEAARVEAQQAERCQSLRLWCEYLEACDMPKMRNYRHVVASFCAKRFQHNTYFWMLCVLDIDPWDTHFEEDGQCKV